MPAVYEHYRYHSLSIALHWIMAILIVFMISSGLAMVYADLEKALQFRLYQIHKATGVVILCSLFVRIACRLIFKAPPYPNSIEKKKQKLASLGHVALYVVLTVVLLSGWAMVSASPYGLPTFVFVDWLKWPHIPGIARNKLVENLANLTHWVSIVILGALIIGHITAVIVHWNYHNLNLLKRMWWNRT